MPPTIWKGFQSNPTPAGRRVLQPHTAPPPCTTLWGTKQTKRPKTDAENSGRTAFKYPNGLNINAPAECSLIYVAFLKPGPLCRLLGPTLAGNLLKNKKTDNIYSSRLAPMDGPPCCIPKVKHPKRVGCLSIQRGWQISQDQALFA